MITFITELQGRGGTIGEDSVRTFKFKSDDATDSEYNVYQNRNCPKIGSQHPSNRFRLFYLKRGDLTISQSDSNWQSWTVEAKYTQLEDEEAPPEEERDFDEPSKDEKDQPDFNPKVSVEFEDYPHPLEYAVDVNYVYDASSPASDGKYPVVNSALEPYSPPPEVFRQNTLIRVTRNLALSSSLWKDALDIRNTINSDKFKWRRGPAVIDVKERQCRIKVRIGEQVDYRSKTGKKSSYANLEVQFVIRKESWNIDLLDQGSQYLDTAGKSINLRIFDDDWAIASGTKILPIEVAGERSLGLLDGTGEKLATGGAKFFNRYQGYVQNNHGTFFKKITRRVKR